MKKKILLLTIIFLCLNYLFAQTPSDQIITVTKPALNFAIGLGPKFNLSKQFDASISPVDSSIQLQKLPTSSFVLSATLMFHIGRKQESQVLSVTNGQSHIYSFKKYNLLKNDKTAAQKLNLTEPKTKKGQIKDPDNNNGYGPWSILASLNLADINSNGASFNKQIDGGLGIGYKVCDALHLGLFLEYSTSRQLQNYITDSYVGKPIMVNNEKLSVLNENDNNIFFTKQIVSIAFKIVIPIGDYNVKLE